MLCLFGGHFDLDLLQQKFFHWNVTEDYEWATHTETWNIYSNCNMHGGSLIPISKLWVMIINTENEKPEINWGKSYIENQRMLKCYRFYQTCCDFHSTVSAFQNDCQKTYPGNKEFRSSLHQPIVYTFVLHIKTHLQPNRVGSFFSFFCCSR